MFVLGSYDFFSLSDPLFFFSQLCDHAVIKTDWCSQSEQMATASWSAPWRPLLWSSGVLPAQHQPGVWWGENATRKTHKGARKWRYWLSTMRVSKWYQEPTREDDDLRSSPSSRVSSVFPGTNRMPYQIREPVGNDEETLAMKRGDMPPAVPKRVANPRIQEDQA